MVRAGSPGRMGPTGSRRRRSTVWTADFINGETLPAGITFSRTSGANRTNASKVLEWMGSDVPRFDYYPDTGLPRGLLIEGASTNIFTNSAEFSNSNWVKSGITVTDDSKLAPDGTNGGDTVTTTTSNATVSHPFFNAGNQAYVVTGWLARAAGSAAISFSVGASSLTPTLAADLSNRYTVVDATVTGTYTCTGGAYTVNIPGVTGHGLATGEYMKFNPTSGAGVGVQMQVTASDANNLTFTNGSATSSGNCTIYARQARVAVANNTDAAYVWGFQADATTFPTSYIPAPVNSVTRTQDNVSIPDLSTIGYPGRGTVYLEVEPMYGSSSPSYSGLCDFTDGTNGNRCGVYKGANSNVLNFEVLSGGAVQASITTGNSINFGAVNKVAISFDTNYFAICLNGGTPVTDLSGTVPTVTKLNLFNSWNGNNPAWARIPKFSFDSTVKTPAQLQGMTA